MKQLVFATNNTHKLDEVRAMLEPDYKIIAIVTGKQIGRAHV